MPLVLEEVETGRELQHPMGGSNQARPGYELVRVSLEPPQGERNPDRCDLALVDAQGTRYRSVTSWWQLTGPGLLVWVFEVPETATGFQLFLPDSTRIDIGL